MRDELAERRAADYPPFARMIALRLDARDAAEARAGATAAAEAARAAGGPAVPVRGPAEAPLGRLRGRTRWQVWLSSHERAPLAAAARAARPRGETGRRPAPLRRRRPAERALIGFFRSPPGRC